MPNYLLAYTGGGGMENVTPEQREEAVAAWGAWFGALGGAVVDPGNPVGPALTISPGGGSRDGGASSLSGYTILSAGSLSEAAGLANGCPLLAHGGSVEVYEIVPIM